MERSIQDLFADAHVVFDHIKEATELEGEADNPLLAILTTPAVDTLGHLSLRARIAASESDELKAEFQNTAQRLIDFLESQEHGNFQKESSAIEMITMFFPTLRKPKTFERHLKS